MKEGGRANALLVELLLVIFFFMISAAILAQIYADAKLKSRTAAATNSAMLEGQNIAEDLYGAENPDAVLQDYGFTLQDSVWVLEKKGYVLKVTQKTEETDSGMLSVSSEKPSASPSGIFEASSSSVFSSVSVTVCSASQVANSSSVMKVTATFAAKLFSPALMLIR